VRERRCVVADDALPEHVKVDERPEQRNRTDSGSTLQLDRARREVKREPSGGPRRRFRAPKKNPSSVNPTSFGSTHFSTPPRRTSSTKRMTISGSCARAPLWHRSQPRRWRRRAGSGRSGECRRVRGCRSRPRTPRPGRQGSARRSRFACSRPSRARATGCEPPESRLPEPETSLGDVAGAGDGAKSGDSEVRHQNLHGGRYLRLYCAPPPRSNHSMPRAFQYLIANHISSSFGRRIWC
jgi:hypothetical protein